MSIEEINEQSTNKPADETLREVLLGDDGEGYERDVAGESASVITPQGREEAKKDTVSDSLKGCSGN